MLYQNPAAEKTRYPGELQAVMSIEKADESRRWISAWSGVNQGATPLHALPGLAAHLGVAQVLLKDEGERSELGSFKALGAPIALVRLILRRWPERGFDAVALFRGAYKEQLADFTVISATDGNHGKGLAAAARSIGCQCVIVLHAHVSQEREQAIAQYGARIVRITGNYDESVAEAARLARVNGWEVVSDTSYDGYEDVPRDVMQGYGVIAAEVVEALCPDEGASANAAKCPFTHVILQGGVGGLAAGVSSYFWERFGAQRPQVIIAEPVQADCLYQSAIAGHATRTMGSVDSVMAGLACGETSPLAWRFLVTGADGFLTMEDDDAVQAMRVLAEGRFGDIPVVAGESGAAGLAGLQVLMASPELAAQAGLDAQSRVLVINTEGATAPSIYTELVGTTADEIRARQQAWLAKVTA